MNIISIIEGNIRYALNIRTSIMVYREENFCMKCPLANEHGKYTGTCSKDKGGCGCGIGAKTSQNKLPCPKGFWGNNWFKKKSFELFLKQSVSLL